MINRNRIQSTKLLKSVNLLKLKVRAGPTDSPHHPSRQRFSIQTLFYLSAPVCLPACSTSSSFNSLTQISPSQVFFFFLILRLSSSLCFFFPFHVLHHIFASLFVSLLVSFHLHRLILSILISLQLLLSVAAVVSVPNVLSCDRCRCR